MKDFWKKRIDFIKKSRKGKLYCIFFLLYLTAIFFAANDAWLYETPIAKLTKVETSVSGEETGTRGTKETKYKQNIQGIILNGKNKGKKISFTNEYTYTGMLAQPYHRGNQVLLNGTKDRMGFGIRGVKRDTELVILMGILVLILIIIAGKQGGLTVLTVGLNVCIFAVGFWKAGDTSNVLEMCSRLVLLFAGVTLFGLNGFHKKTWAALLSTILVLAMIMGIFDIVIQHVDDLDYSTMEYLGSIDNPDEIFHAEILLSGLGAIMDVTVAIAAALSEIVRQKPKVTFLELFKSGREIGYDIMGTMINVLLFVFGCGLIPTCIVRMNNDVSLFTIIRLHIPCELCRFFVESIGIILAIPVSVLVTSVMMKLSYVFHGRNLPECISPNTRGDSK